MNDLQDKVSENLDKMKSVWSYRHLVFQMALPNNIFKSHRNHRRVLREVEGKVEGVSGGGGGIERGGCSFFFVSYSKLNFKSRNALAASTTQIAITIFLFE